MTSPEKQKDALEKLCEAAIQKHLGSISSLPEELSIYVKRVYNNFVAAYLNVLRQKEDKPGDWFPQKWSIDPELADDMRHFFSDYLHITREFFMLNAKMQHLGKIDQQGHPNLYQHAVDDILQLHNPQPGPGE